MAKKKPKPDNMIDPGRYEVIRIRDKDGTLRYSRGNHDAVAKALLLHRAFGKELEQVVRANGLMERMKPHWKKPPGQFRMTLGVMLRGLVRNGTPVKIGTVLVEKLTQKVELPKVEPLDGAKPAKKARAAKPAAPRKRKSKADDREFSDELDSEDRQDDELAA